MQKPRVTSENVRAKKRIVPKTNAGAVSLGLGKSADALSGTGLVAGADEAGGSYGGGAFSDSSLSGSVFVVVVASASGTSFSSVEGLAVHRSQIVSPIVAITVMNMTRVTPSAEDMKPARRHLAAVRRGLWWTVTFPIVDFV